MEGQRTDFALLSVCVSFAVDKLSILRVSIICFCCCFSFLRLLFFFFFFSSRCHLRAAWIGGLTVKKKWYHLFPLCLKFWSIWLTSKQKAKLNDYSPLSVTMILFFHCRQLNSKRWKLVALDWQGTQQQRPESGTVTSTWHAKNT